MPSANVSLLKHSRLDGSSDAYSDAARSCVLAWPCGCGIDAEGCVEMTSLV